MMPRRTRLATCLPGLLSVLLVLMAGLGCGDKSPAGRYNLILISVDTLRADRLGTYGYPRATSPNIDRWAEDALVFTNTVAETSWTLPSHVTMLSGLLPGNHSTVLPDLRPGESVDLLAEIFAAAGYTAIGLTDGGYMVPEHGFDRGFDLFNSRKKTFDVALRRAFNEIARLDPSDRFFLLLHTYHVHCPYDPAEVYRQQFLSEDTEFIETAGRCGNPDFNQTSLSPGQVRYLSDSYDASIRELDDYLGEFFDRLRSAGHFEDTVIILTSDHGEEFGEHGQIGHERTLYRESLMVPLIISSPDLDKGRIDRSAGLVDIAPTALALAGIDSNATFDGRALTDIKGDATDPTAGARISELSWQGSLRSVMTPDWHLILDLETRQPALFAVGEDLAESSDLAWTESEAVELLMDELRRYQSTLDPRTAEPIGPQDPEHLEQLRALGYIN